MAEDEKYEIPRKKSGLRQDIEEALKRSGISIERRISVLNLETKEQQFFDSYPEALEFMKGKKGRWYLTTPGFSYDRRRAENPKP